MPFSRPDSSVVPAAKASILPTLGGPYFALAVLFGMNLLNYIDRYSFFAVGTQITAGFARGRLLVRHSEHVVHDRVHVRIAADGMAGRSLQPPHSFAGGVALWSLATVGSAFSADFYHMFFWRSLLGVGEASYGVIAPALIADLFATNRRGRAMGIYYLALPLGGRSATRSAHTWVRNGDGPGRFWSWGCRGFWSRLPGS